MSKAEGGGTAQVILITGGTSGIGQALGEASCERT